MVVGSPSVDSNGVKYYPVTSVYQGSDQQVIRVLEPTNPVAGKPRRILYVLPVDQGVDTTDSTWSDGLEELRMLDVQDRFNMTLIAPSFNYNPWYGDNATAPSLRMESFIIDDLIPWGDTFLKGTVPQRYLIGFSKSGNGVLDLMLRHPSVFNAGAAWDSPAQQSSLSASFDLPENFGTQANYNTYFIPSLVASNAAAFTQQDRLWISGDQAAWTADMDTLNTQMTAAGIAHTWVAGPTRAHSWNSGWLNGAVTDLDANATNTAPVGEAMAPPRTGGWPEATLASGTTQTTLTLKTDQKATCRYSTTAGVAYNSMANTFTTTGGTAHSTVVSSLQSGTNYNYSVRCQDTASGIVNPDDYVISFSVAPVPSSVTVSSSFAGAENPLSENGMWSATGSWNTLQKSTGAYTTQDTSAARLAVPSIPADQFSEITFDQNPGANSWPAVMTRIQGPTSGSGYLAIANSGEVYLYRVDDGGSLGFTWLGDTSAPIGTAPRRLRLESQGSTHRVYFNGTLLITATDSVYSIGQPGIAAAVEGGPTVKILTFSGGALNSGPDTTPPVRSNGAPTGTLASGTTTATLTLATNEVATCRYSTTAGVAYSAMTLAFTSTGGTAQSAAVTGLKNGTTDNYYVRCQDTAGNANPDDYLITFSVSAADTTPPVLSAGAPTGSLAAGTTQTTLSLTTNEAATCRYSTTAGIAYASMTLTFSTTGGTAQATTVTGLKNGTSYTYYVRCKDTAGNANTSDYPISFSVAAADTTPPVLSAGAPTGSLAAGTTQTTLSLTTNEAATCRYSTTAGIAYASMTLTFSTTGGTAQATTVTGLKSGTSYTYYVRCKDTAGNANTSDYPISFSVAAADTTPPVRSAGSPTGTLAAGTTQTTLSLATNEAATCRYSTTAGVAYASMTKTFSGAGGTAQSTTVTGLVNGTTYNYYVRCQDTAGNANPDDYIITFSVASAADTTPPVRSAGAPTGTLAAGTTQTTLSLTTNEAATCRYSTTAGVAYASMTKTFTGAGGTAQSATVTGLANGTTYNYYVRCQDTAGNANPDDYLITFSVANAADTTPPVRSAGAPTGTLAAGTTQTTLSLTTNEAATCRYSATAGVAYASMTATFTGAGGTAQSATITGLVNGATYNYYVRCQDTAGNANPDDYLITFSVASAGTTTATSSFTGVESPLSENGMWATTGSWGSLSKNNGAYTTTLTSAARLASPVVGPDEFAEITFDQDPGSAAWPAVMTRIQSATNGSGYLAIAYNGEVILYQTDDTGSLNFTWLAAADATLGTAPRRLRLESQGNVHRVYFNGTLMITYTDTSNAYPTGTPGIAAAIFGGPTVHILTFSGGSL